MAFPFKEVLSELRDLGPIAILLRHAGGARAAADDPVTFTKQDEDTAASIGRDLSLAFSAAGITLTAIHASFGYPHCIQSAEAIAKAWPQLPRVREDKMLGNPSVFIEDLEMAKEAWNTLGKSKIAEALLSGESVPGWSRDPSADARRLADHVLSVAGAAGNAGLFVTHDIVIAATVRWMGGKAIAVENLPRATVIHRTELGDIGVVW